MISLSLSLQALARCFGGRPRSRPPASSGASFHGRAVSPLDPVASSRGAPRPTPAPSPTLRAREPRQAAGTGLLAWLRARLAAAGRPPRGGTEDRPAPARHEVVLLRAGHPQANRSAVACGLRRQLRTLPAGASGEAIVRKVGADIVACRSSLTAADKAHILAGMADALLEREADPRALRAVLALASGGRSADVLFNDPRYGPRIAGILAQALGQAVSEAAPAGEAFGREVCVHLAARCEPEALAQALAQFNEACAERLDRAYAFL
ncbi:hypothetical protein ACT80S_17670 [Ramlibacter sp. MAHUQ-53]|uniref:hypothetical protein n=1 Tax=unclassified Ramlibacter TaxID=2617605 RepID=UPI00362DEF6C